MLLALLILLVAAPVASAAVTVEMKVAPLETVYGEPTEITGAVAVDGLPAAGRTVQLEGERYPFESDPAVLATATTAADGTFRFSEQLERNTLLRVTTIDGASERTRAYVFPATTLSFRARSSRVIKLTQRYTVPRRARLKQPTLFYVGPRGADRAERSASAKLVRTRAGRYRSTAIVRIPAKWEGRFRYASCFRYTVGSGMGNPRASCPKKFRF